MKVLLIGKNGMTGKAFINAYAHVHEITAVGKDDDLNQLPNIDYDAAFFLAQSGDYKNTVLSEDLYEVNINYLYSVLSKMQFRIKKFVYFSTGSVYKATIDGIYTENSLLNINEVSPYVASKLAGELMVRTFTLIPSRIILRPFFIYGKEQKDSMLFKTMHRKIVNEEEIVLNGEEGLIFNPVYVEDVASLMNQLIIDTQHTGDTVYNIAGSEVVTLSGILDAIAKKLGKHPNLKIQATESTRYIGNVNIPGWEATTTINTGIAKTFFSEQ